jgi:hypothetical protein
MTDRRQSAAIDHSELAIDGHGDLLVTDFDRLTDVIGQRELTLRHGLADHPLLGFDALAKLADVLPANSVDRRASGDHPISMDADMEGNFSEPASETVRNIKQRQCWVILRNVEQVTEYFDTMNEILDEVAPRLPPREGGMTSRELFIQIISAPHARIPPHFDPEHNFFLQVHGSEEFHVGHFPDRTTEILEFNRFWDGNRDRLFSPPEESNAFSLSPGDGVYTYPRVPHWVSVSSDVSISLSVTFRTRRSKRFERASVLNRHLRRFGIPTRPAGESEIVDGAKAASVAWLGRLRRHGQGSSRRPSSSLSLH